MRELAHCPMETAIAETRVSNELALLVVVDPVAFIGSSRLLRGQSRDLIVACSRLSLIDRDCCVALLRNPHLGLSSNPARVHCKTRDRRRIPPRRIGSTVRSVVASRTSRPGGNEPSPRHDRTSENSSTRNFDRFSDTAPSQWHVCQSPLFSGSDPGSKRRKILEESRMQTAGDLSLQNSCLLASFLTRSLSLNSIGRSFQNRNSMKRRFVL